MWFFNVEKDKENIFRQNKITLFYKERKKFFAIHILQVYHFIKQQKKINKQNDQNRKAKETNSKGSWPKKHAKIQVCYYECMLNFICFRLHNMTPKNSNFRTTNRSTKNFALVVYIIYLNLQHVRFYKIPCMIVINNIRSKGNQNNISVF